MSRTTVLSPAALTIGQKVSLLTSVTLPTVWPTVSKLDLTLKSQFLFPLELDLITAFFFEPKHEEEDDEDGSAIICFAPQANDGGD